MKRWLISLLIFVAFINGSCSFEKKPISQSGDISQFLSQHINSTSIEKVYEYRITKPAVVFFDNEEIYAVTEIGEVFEIEKSTIQNMDLRSGDIMDFLRIYVYSDGREVAFCEEEARSITRYPTPIFATKENAPFVYANYMLSQKMYNGFDDAICGFTINDINIIVESNNIIKFKINFSFVPARYAKVYEGYNPFLNEYEQLPLFENQEMDITLVGVNGSWTNIKNNSYGVDLPNQIDRYHTVNVKDYQLSEDQYALFENVDFTYWWEKKINDDGEGGFISSIYSYNHSDGKIRKIIDNIENINFDFKDYFNGKILLTSTNYIPFSESVNGPLFIIEEELQNVTIIPSKYLFSITDEGIFFACSEKSILCFYNYKYGKITEYINTLLDIEELYWDDEMPYIFGLRNMRRCLNSSRLKSPIFIKIFLMSVSIFPNNAKRAIRAGFSAGCF